MRRHDCLRALAARIGDALVVANSGTTSNQWAELRAEGNLLQCGVGLVLPVSIGLALALPHRRVVALDGDGSALLYASALASLATTNPRNLLAVVLDNEAYGISTGTWPSASARGADLAGMAAAAGVARTAVATDVAGFVGRVEEALQADGATYLVAKIETAEEPRPALREDQRENKYRFVRHVERLEGKGILSPGRIRPAYPSAGESASSGDVAAEVMAALQAAGVDFAVTLPTSEMRPILERLHAASWLSHVEVANENDGAALCAGAWLGGRRPALVIENSGLLVSAYALTRVHATFGIPLLLVVSYRGSLAETAAWAVALGQATEPLFAALGITARVVREVREVRPAILGAATAAQTFLRPYAVALSSELPLAY